MKEWQKKDMEKSAKELFDRIFNQIKDAIGIKEGKGDNMESKKKIEVELPLPPCAGGYACCPSGDIEYDEDMKVWHKAVNAKILEAIPHGYKLTASEVKEIKIVKHVAEIVVEKV